MQNYFRCVPTTLPDLDITSEIIVREEFLRKCDRALNHILHFAAKDFEIKILHDTVPIPDIDRQEISIIEIKTMTEWQMPEVECSIYAFYHLRLPHAVNYLIGKITIEQYREFKYPTIMDNDFELVDDPQEGDLIHYLDNDMIPVHFGVLKDSCTVISKWGDLPQIFEHTLHKCPYGESFAIYRKKANK